MNIHPLFVHFPIALLTVYSLLELVATLAPALRRRSWLFPINAFLLILGTLAAFGAIYTGDAGAEASESTANAYIHELHAPFALATTVIYAILAAAYLVRLADRGGWFGTILVRNPSLAAIFNFKKYIAHLILDTWLLPVLALAGLITLTITGALGAAIVYGPNVDPFVTFIYHLFWAQ